MFVIMFDYRAYGVPDECAHHLMNVLAVLQPLKTDSSWNPKEFTIEEEPLRIECYKVHDSKIKTPSKEPEIAEKNKEINIDQEIPF